MLDLYEFIFHIKSQTCWICSYVTNYIIDQKSWFAMTKLCFPSIIELIVFGSLVGFVYIFNTVCEKCHCIMPLSSISNVLWITSKVLFDRGNIKINYFLWSTFPFVLHINLFSRFLEVLRIFIAYFNDKNVESFECGNWIMLLPDFGRRFNWLYLSGRIYT